MSSEFANPMAPPGSEIQSGAGSSYSSSLSKQKLTNDDFRKIVQSSRRDGHEKDPTAAGESSSKGSGAFGSGGHHRTFSANDPKASTPATPSSSEKKKKKKSHLNLLPGETVTSKREEWLRRKELQAKYHDRAKERRERESGVSGGYTRDDRDGADVDAPTVERSGLGDYRAMAPPDSSINPSVMKERRMQSIQESKFLGGDLEHTHLVKGLDYALLDKVRVELNSREKDEEKLEQLYNEQQARLAVSVKASSIASSATKKAAAALPSTGSTTAQAQQIADSDLQIIDSCQTTLAKSLFKHIFLSDSVSEEQSAKTKKLAMFAPKRMAYVVELLPEDEIGMKDAGVSTTDDIPTALMRSTNDTVSDTLTLGASATQNLIIEKLGHLLSYMRTGKRAAVSSSKDKHESSRQNHSSDSKSRKSGSSAVADPNVSIYDDPSSKAKYEATRSSSTFSFRRPYAQNSDKNSSSSKYFDRDDHKKKIDAGSDRDSLIKNIRNKYGVEDDDESGEQRGRDAISGRNAGANTHGGIPLMGANSSSSSTALSRRQQIQQSSEYDSYAECFPDSGGREFNWKSTATSASDKAATIAAGAPTSENLFPKKHTGISSGNAISKFDYDDDEEYEKAKLQQEVAPRAAFQYGVKLADGRRTRKRKGGPGASASTGGGGDGGSAGDSANNQKLEREWQQIQQILNKKSK